MPNNYVPTEYNGPKRNHVPDADQRGSSPAKTKSVTNTRNYDGYYNLPYLKDLLDKMIDSSDDVIKICRQKMHAMSYSIETNDQALHEAHAAAYPLDNVPEYITFKEYIYHFRNPNSNAALRILRAYENAIRSPSGDNSLDIYHIVRLIRDESLKVKGFIANESFKELNDSAQHRTIEIFQDWGETAQGYIENARKTLQGKNPAAIPPAELDKVTPEQSSNLQAFFKVKLNSINLNINALFNQLFNYWENPSESFYNDVLLKALDFQLRVSKKLKSINIDELPILGQEVKGTLIGLEANYSVALADQLKRNALFWDYIPQIFANIHQRDAYVVYLTQLASKGKRIKNIFSPLDSIENQNFPIPDPSANNRFLPSHGDLSGINDDTAHPQYLLRSGGSESTIIGDITLEDGIKIDGIIPHLHAHTGEDGSTRLTSDSFEDNSVGERALDTSQPTTSRPRKVKSVDQTAYLTTSGQAKVKVTVGFAMTLSNAVSYEFEVIKI